MLAAHVVRFSFFFWFFFHDLTSRNCNIFMYVGRSECFFCVLDLVIFCYILLHLTIFITSTDTNRSSNAGINVKSRQIVHMHTLRKINTTSFSFCLLENGEGDGGLPIRIDTNRRMCYWVHTTATEDDIDSCHGFGLLMDKDVATQFYCFASLAVNLSLVAIL